MTDLNKSKPIDDLLEGIALRALELPANNIPEDGREYEYRADEGELKRLSQLVGLGTFNSLVIKYAVVPYRKNLVRMSSVLTGDVKQVCGVSLAPVINRLEDEVVTLFVPARKFEEMANLEDEDVLSGENFEPINDRRLEIGRVLYEQLIGAVDPYPRADGVEYDPSTGGDGEIELRDEGPFAVLAGLKKDTEN